jgi:hypothetical protein
MKNFLKDWKTSSIALLTAVLVLLNIIFPNVFTTDVNIKVVGALTAILALLASDSKTNVVNNNSRKTP